MFMRAFLLLLVGGWASAWGQSNVEFANLREDVRIAAQRLGELSLRVEQLERENAQLKAQADSASKSFATIAQVNEAIAELNRVLKATLASSRAETLEVVARQIERLAQQTDVALQAVVKNQNQRQPASFPEDFPKEGMSYTVQKGETLATIAKKTGAKIQDIINANKLVDPSKIQVGQVLFIPGGK
ncbi:MAG: LysM peptidoglycan-binding domain-containing protein [Opitutaceae bacterium]|nr:LysM peptidoglycan-binding domain-containing protein [Opitutaceae bacterium]